MRLIKVIQDGYDMVRVQGKNQLLQMIEDVIKKEEGDYSEGDKLEDMIHDVEKHFIDCSHLIECLKDDAEKNL